MTEEEYKQMLADREAGTQGDFTYDEDENVVWLSEDAAETLCEYIGNPADGFRFARVPQMEAEIIRLRGVLAEMMLLSDDDTSRKAEAALKGDDQ